jgi:DNA polymerase III alpha subunit (gram-positive type)
MSPIPQAATDIHGITNSMVADYHHFDYYWNHLHHKFFEGKILLGYNVFYDVRMINQTMAAVGLENARSWSPLAVIDVMQTANIVLRLKRWMSLSDLFTFLGIEYHPDALFHNAVYDAKITAMIWNKLVKMNDGMKTIL